MIGDMIEREIKVAVGADFTLPDLNGVRTGIVARQAGELDLRATYWDTIELHLARRGLALRHRNDQGWILKRQTHTEGATLVREETSAEGPADRVPTPLLDAVREVVGRAHLVRTATLRTQRRVVELVEGDAAPCAEVVDDRVTVYDGRRVAARFREVEIELLTDEAGDLGDAVVQRVLGAGGLGVHTLGKYVHALRALGYSVSPTGGSA